MLERRPRSTGLCRARRSEGSAAAAGKLFPIGEGVATCLVEALPRPVTPPEVEKFLNTRRPNPGAERIFYGRANDPDTAYHMTHGINTAPSFSAGLLINPPRRTLFQQRMLEKVESGYSSRRRAPLGKSYDQRPLFPPGTDLDSITFGCKMIRGSSAGELINPPKSFQEVNEDARAGHELYILTHNDYNAGEQRHRKYDWLSYKKDASFGMKTPHFIDGRLTAKTLRWLHESQMKEAAKIVSKRLDDFRGRFQHQLGKVYDPIAETMNVPPGHTFGLIVPLDKYGVGDCLHYTAAKNFLHGKDRHRAILAAVRQHLKKANYQNFGSLLEAFRHYDKKGDGKIDKEELKKTCAQFGLDLDPELVDALLEYCDVDEDGLINFVEFANFLNWKDKMAIGELEENIITRAKKIDLEGLSTQKVKECPGIALAKPEDLTPREKPCSGKTPKTLTRPADHVLHVYSTTSSAINAVVGGPSSAYYRKCGVPSIRTDIPVPAVHRFGDRTNYGDESNVFAALCPSVYTEKGVYEKDFFQPRPKEEIARLFYNIGVSLPEDTFEAVWKLAASRNPKGEVCIETMRNVLEEIQASDAPMR